MSPALRESGCALIVCLQTIKLSISSPASQDAAAIVEEASGRGKDVEQVERLSKHNQSRIDSRNLAYSQLLPELLRVAQDPKSHWRYTLTATVSLCSSSAPVARLLTIAFVALPPLAHQARPAAAS